MHRIDLAFALCGLFFAFPRLDGPRNDQDAGTGQAGHSGGVPVRGQTAPGRTSDPAPIRGGNAQRDAAPQQRAGGRARQHHRERRQDLRAVRRRDSQDEARRALLLRRRFLRRGATPGPRADECEWRARDDPPDGDRGRRGGHRSDRTDTAMGRHGGARLVFGRFARPSSYGRPDRGRRLRTRWSPRGRRGSITSISARRTTSAMTSATRS